MKFLIIFLMLASVGGMIFGLRRHREGAMWGKPLTVACLVIAFVLVAINMKPERGSREGVRREQAYQQALGRKLIACGCRPSRG